MTSFPAVNCFLGDMDLRDRPINRCCTLEYLMKRICIYLCDIEAPYIETGQKTVIDDAAEHTGPKYMAIGSQLVVLGKDCQFMILSTYAVDCRYFTPLASYDLSLQFVTLFFAFKKLRFKIHTTHVDGMSPFISM